MTSQNRQAPISGHLGVLFISSDGTDDSMTVTPGEGTNTTPRMRFGPGWVISIKKAPENRSIGESASDGTLGMLRIGCDQYHICNSRSVSAQDFAFELNLQLQHSSCSLAMVRGAKVEYKGAPPPPPPLPPAAQSGSAPKKPPGPPPGGPAKLPQFQRPGYAQPIPQVGSGGVTPWSTATSGTGHVRASGGGVPAGGW